MSVIRVVGLVGVVGAERGARVLCIGDGEGVLHAGSEPPWIFENI